MNAGVQQLLRVGRNVADMDRALAFYRDALGFEVTDADASSPAWTRLAGVDATPTRCAQLSLGTQQIELTEFPDATRYPANSTSADLWFQHCAIVVDDMDAAYTRLLRHSGETAISRDGAQTLPASSGGVTAFKFRDPDLHPLELISFPPGSGDPLWQQHANGSTLGIDHSAISVADIERSIAFYQRLGLSVASRGNNSGTQQRRLDGLDDAEVDVIALQPAAATTPHVELLGYRVSHDRECPHRGIRDIAADRLVLQTNNLSALLDKLSDAHAGVVTADSATAAPVALLRDPDGHQLVLIE